MVTVVLISGASGSGKSTIAKKVADSILSLDPDRKVAVLQQDNYFTETFLPYHERHDFSFENGFGINWDKLVMDMKSFTEVNNDQDSVVLVEGHMLGAAATQFFESFNGKASIALVFIQCSKDICKSRRLGRRKRSEQEWNELNTYIDDFVWPSFVETGIPMMDKLRNHAKLSQVNKRDVSILDVFTENPKTLEKNVQRIVETITKHQNTTSEQQEVTEAWPSLAGDLRGFAHHQALSIQLDHSEDDRFEIECVSSLSPLDMVNLSHGSHDATGHSVWMGAFLLIEALASNLSFKCLKTQQISLRNLFCSKRVLELGCGTGVGGLSVLLAPETWQSKPSHVAFSDIDDEVIALCRKNCERHLHSDSISCRDEPLFSTFALNWGDAAPQNESGDLYDVVLATDVLYDMACLRPLLSTTLQSIREGGFFVLAHVPRSCLPESASINDNPQVEGDYHAILENHLTQTASELGLQTCAIIRPKQIQNAAKSKCEVPLNSTSLLEMEDAGAAMFVFQKR